MTRIYTALISFTILFSFTSFGQIFPYKESFDSYTASQPLSGHGGITATNHVYVTAHGVVGNCAEFQMAPSATHDTLLSPLVGPLTVHSITSFYFRVVTYVGSTPILYNMTAGDQAKIIVYDSNFSLNTTQYIIDNSHQNTTASYVKVVVGIPSALATNSGWFKIVAVNTSGHTWLLEFDSLVVKDTLVIHPVVTLVSSSNVTCRGDSDGTITIAASGASPPYRYLWSNGQTTATATHLAGGVYTVTVTDSLNATSTLTDTISQPQFTLQLDSLVKTNVRCKGDASGSARVYPTGGTPGYTYSWSATPVQTTQQILNIHAGNYTVTVTDSRGCAVTASAPITQPAIGMTATVSSTGTHASNGTATVTVSGGLGTLTYLWSPFPQTTATAVGLSPGMYTVTVTDSIGCTLIDSVRVADLTGIKEMDNTALKLYPNPASEHLYISLDGRTQNVMSVTIADISGRIVLTDNVAANNMNISSLTDGVYVIRVINGDKSYIRRLVIQR